MYRNSKIKLPEFPLEDVEDFYTYYVQIVGISEELFWNSPINFIKSVVANKSAFDEYINKQIERMNSGK